MNGLTQLQADALTAIAEMTTADGVAPSYEELKQRLGLASKSNVNRVLTCLRERGYIDWIPNHARSVRVLQRPVADRCGVNDLSPEELGELIARAAGVLAYKQGDKHAFTVCCRVAGALGQPNAGRA